jgi:uncharacterized Zn-binding protein involved in type VI secretion
MTGKVSTRQQHRFTRLLAVFSLVTLSALLFVSPAVFAQDEPANETKVFLELTYPAGRSPAVFTEGWVFGARCSYIRQSDSASVDCSDDVTWSGSGSFLPETGRTSRPRFEFPGSNNITLSLVIDGVRQQKNYPVQAVSPSGYAKLGDTIQCLQAMATANLDPLVMSGIIISGSTNVTIAGLPAAREGDAGMVPSAGSSDAMIESGDHNVLIDGRPAARSGDRVRCAFGNGVIGRMGISQPDDADLSGAGDLARCAGASAQVEAARGYVQRGDILRGDIDAARRLLNSARAAGCAGLEPDIAAVAAAADAVMHATRQDAEAAIASCDPHRMVITRAKLRDASTGAFDEEIAKLDRIIGAIGVARSAIETAVQWRDEGSDATSIRISFTNAQKTLASIRDIVRCPELERHIADGLADLDKAGELASDADTALRTCDTGRIKSMLEKLAGTSNKAIAGKARRLEAAIDAIASAEENFRLYQEKLTAGDFTAAWVAVSRASRLVSSLQGASCDEQRRRFNSATWVVQEHYYAERDAKLALQSCNLNSLYIVRGTIERLGHPALKRHIARIDAAIGVAEEYQAAIEATRAENYEEADRLMQSTKALLDKTDEADCPWIREDLTKATEEGSETPVSAVHFVIKVKGSGYIPHWSGGSWSTEGENEEVFTLRRGQDLKTELKAYCEVLVDTPEEMVNPPAIPGQVKRPVFWNEGPEIEVISDKIFTYTEARIRALTDTWAVDQKSNHGPLSELKKRYKKRGCRIKDS